MTEKKNSLYKRLYGDEKQAKAAIAEAFAEEERSKEITKLQMQGVDIKTAIKMTEPDKKKEWMIRRLNA